MKLIHAAFLMLSHIAFAQCPDTGAATFYKSEHGFNGYRLLGSDSYWSLFVGTDFEAANQDGLTRFWLDGCFLEWALIAHKEFMPLNNKQKIDALSAFYQYESGFLQKIVHDGQTEMEGFSDFTPFTSKGPDGTERTFKIWTAMLGKGKEKVPQYWIATIHPRGAAILSIIQVKSKDDAKVKLLIDSYIANFGTVSGKVCQTLRADTAEPTKKPN